MIKHKCNNFLEFVYRHYNFITIFEKNSKYKYIPGKIYKENGSIIHEYNIVETNKVEYESNQSYRTDTIFNQEPRLFKERCDVVSK